MEWLTQNWVWLALAAGMVLLMRRGGAGGCCGVSHGGHGGHDAREKTAETTGATPGAGGGASCCGGHSANDKHAGSAQTKPTVEAHGHTH